ncbi:MAG: hypothetical protein LBI71_03020 [Enterobacteriaceae bacterium]|jgi:hypothetical protein|nr:hypothetical protein [Enterobacteriaceae bacterium]
MINNILLDAIRHARIIFRGKTTNKTYYNTEHLNKIKRKKYSIERVREREDRHDKFLDRIFKIKNITKKYDYFLSRSRNYRWHNQSLIGNCGELSISALCYLAQQRSQDLLNWVINSGKRNIENKTTAIYILNIEFINPYDHMSTVILFPENNQNLPKINKIYHSYDDLPDNSWVCDPWANIVCQYREYHSQWRNKMDKWNSVGKSASIYQDEQLEDYPSPLTLNNYNAIIRIPKKVINMAMIFPDGKIEIKQR